MAKYVVDVFIVWTQILIKNLVYNILNFIYILFILKQAIFKYLQAKTIKIKELTSSRKSCSKKKLRTIQKDSCIKLPWF